MKKKDKKNPRAITLLGNLRIREQNAERSEKRARNVLLANQVRKTQLQNQYKLELERAKNLLQYIPTGLQRDAVLLNRGILQNKYEHLEL